MQNQWFVVAWVYNISKQHRCRWEDEDIDSQRTFCVHDFKKDSLDILNCNCSQVIDDGAEKGLFFMQLLRDWHVQSLFSCWFYSDHIALVPTSFLGINQAGRVIQNHDTSIINLWFHYLLTKSENFIRVRYSSQIHLSHLILLLKKQYRKGTNKALAWCTMLPEQISLFFHTNVPWESHDFNLIALEKQIIV